MSFITVHQENGFCGYEMNLLNIEEVAAVGPVTGANKWFVQTSHACLRLKDGRTINVRETIAAIQGLLLEAKVRKTYTEPRVASHYELKRKLASAW